MQPKFIKSGSTSTKRHAVDLPAGRFSALVFTLSGTAADNTAIAPDAIGRIRLVRNGEDQQGESLRFYHDYTDLKGGAPTLENVSATPGTDQRFIAIIPAFIKGIPNSWDFASNDEADFVIELDAALDTVFPSGAQWELYGLASPTTPETYNLLVREQDVQASAAGRLSETINGVNTAALYVYDDGDVLESLQVEVDGETVVDNISFPLLLDLTNAENRVENKRIELKETSWLDGQPANAYNQNTDATFFFTGGGTVEVTAFQIRESNRRETSVAAVRQVLAKKSGVQAMGQKSRGMKL